MGPGQDNPEPPPVNRLPPGTHKAPARRFSRRAGRGNGRSLRLAQSAASGMTGCLDSALDAGLASGFGSSRSTLSRTGRGSPKRKP